MTLQGHDGLTCTMHIRNELLLSGNADGTLKIWDIPSGTAGPVFQHGSLSFSVSNVCVCVYGCVRVCVYGCVGVTYAHFTRHLCVDICISLLLIQCVSGGCRHVSCSVSLCYCTRCLCDEHWQHIRTHIHSVVGFCDLLT